MPFSTRTHPDPDVVYATVSAVSVERSWLEVSGPFVQATAGLLTPIPLALSVWPVMAQRIPKGQATIDNDYPFLIPLSYALVKGK